MRRNSAEYGRQRRQRLKEAGLCVYCAKDFARKGVSECEACSNKHRKSAREYAPKLLARRFALGLCTKCGQAPPQFARKQCTPCLELARIKNKARRKPGMCSYCQERPKAKDSSRCKKCQPKNKVNYTRWGALNNNISRLAQKFVTIANYLADTNIPNGVRDRAREQEKAALRDLFTAVHAMQAYKKSMRGPSRRVFVQPIRESSEKVAPQTLSLLVPQSQNKALTA